MLRSRGALVPWGTRYPMKKGDNTAGKFVTTLHSINSGINKLKDLTPNVRSYRGVSGMRMPPRLTDYNTLGGRLGIDFAFISTSTDKAVAMRYGTDWDASRGLSFLLEFEMDSLNKGAIIGWLSQYPTECEILMPPLTGLEMTSDHVIQGTMRHCVFRPTLNQRTIVSASLSILYIAQLFMCARA